MKCDKINSFTIDSIAIDASSVCQLRCPECSTSKGVNKNGIVGSGMLSFANFSNLLQQNEWIKRVELSNWGEIFLNPCIYDIMKYAFKKNIKLTAGNGVNFNKVDDNVLEGLVKYKFGYLNISIDGASQETYSKYRIGGSFASVLNNIRRLNYYKDKYNSLYPKISLQFIVFGHNEHELIQVKKLCQELNMAFYPKLNYSQFSPVRDKKFVRRESGLGVATRDEFKEKYNQHYKRPCCQLWTSPQINWDGKLLGCCVNKWAAFGNVFKEGLMNSVHSEKYQMALNVLMGNVEASHEIPCFFCPTYKQIKEKPVSKEELSYYAAFIHPAELQ